MASPAIIYDNGLPIDGPSSDYGSDFSPEEELLVHDLLSNVSPRYATLPDLEDNPIATGIRYHESQQLLHVRRVLGRAQRSSEDDVSLEDVMAVSAMDERSTSIEVEHLLGPNCEILAGPAIYNSD